ncbi:type I restriction endonuclease subunit R [Candidatus Magnetomorum sp. HK-1]|nr:type I restriction endonuclease subunit R [Candidatus Magnetomorum sp. HK-1]
MAQIHTEQIFEESIEQELIASGGYIKGNPADFDRDIAIDKLTLIRFLKQSQPNQWEKLTAIHDNAIETNVIKRLVKELKLRGCLEVIRKGFTDYGVKFQMAFFKPETTLNPDSQTLYDSNILTVTRQLKYSPRNENTLDLVLGLNGLPIATVELKNQFTGQNVENAKKQYKKDRSPKDLIFQFKKRSLVHFTVDTDEAWMTTKIEGSRTFYLPFNKGFNNGKGNPPNPNGYRTEYLWKDVWAKDSWMDIVGKFLHLEKETVEIDGKKTAKEKMIFPRFHQLEVVRRLSADAKKSGAGKNYLIQHSAGSGKSNSIAWLAYRLSSLHNVHDDRVFDSVIVITDRRVLDAQLQDTIYQFEHKAGVVKKIDRDSNQLAQAIYHGSNIVITTLQKFPFVIDKITEIEKIQGKAALRNYAVIVDEAHSSQGGEASRKMKEILSGKSLEEAMRDETDDPNADDLEDEIRKTMMSRGQQKNLSFFAFTATPKAKTLEVFGVTGPDGKPIPFHLYSMRQAIEENFILDVLKAYTTYQTFFKLTKSIEDDPKVDKRKAKTAIARFVSLHPHNLSQKTEVMVEHFRQVVSKKINGRAKAMVVTSSRLHAVRYKIEFDKYIKEKGYHHIKTLVAFSGIVNDDGTEYKETQMNQFGEKELPEKFNTPEYQILLVADKYQTGFDQPLLHTMYVDKKLSGVKAVQTLSRLNRTCRGKEDTFVLDFSNEAEDIKEAFQPYYEMTALKETTDPNLLYDQKNRIEQTQIIWQSEVDNLAKVFFDPRFNPSNQGKLNAFIDPAVERFKQLPEDDTLEGQISQNDCKHLMVSFTRLYAFLSQIIPFFDVDLEKIFVYLRLLIQKLPKETIEKKMKLDDEVALEFYRINKTGDSPIIMEPLAEYKILPPTEAGLRRKKDDEKTPLSEIIQTINDRFETEFGEGDRLFFEQIVEGCVSDENLKVQAQANTIDNFKFPFEELFNDKIIERMDQNQDLFNRLMEGGDFATSVSNAIMHEVYRRLKEQDTPINK